MEDAPLEGVRVLECSSFLAGPVAAMLLADWGADVVKLEPIGGEVARHFEPASEPGMSSVFLAGNRGKRSVCADLRHEDGRRLAAALAARADVVIHNLRDDIADGLGLRGEALRAANPGAVVCGISAFGPDGPYARRTAIDPVIQAITGMMALTGLPDGPPVRSGAQIIDMATGLAAAAAALAALCGRERGDQTRPTRPADVAVSLLDVGLLLNASFYTVHSLTGAPPPRHGDRSHPILADQFPAADGFVVLGVWDEERWARLCRLLGHEGWLEREGWDSNDGRLEDYAAVRAAVSAETARWEAQRLVEALTAEGITAAKTLGFDDVVVDPHVTATGALYRESRLPGDVRLVSGPARLGPERLPLLRRLPPPRAGEHTREVLADWLGPATGLLAAAE
jgi:crotonobetainyl-CoA:carnitine CoA-transferase CaiB-like acyl-CoA transferase